MVAKLVWIFIDILHPPKKRSGTLIFRSTVVQGFIIEFVRNFYLLEGYIISVGSMTMNPEHTGVNDLDTFIAHWEREVERLKEQALEFDECCKISDGFHRDWNGLLVRRTTSLSDNEYIRLQELDTKLNSALAMVCRCSRDPSL